MATTTFAAVVLTAPPPGQASEAGGAYVKVDAREALLRSVELFLNRDAVGQVLLVVQPDDVEGVKQRHGNHLGFVGVKLVTGGPRWTDQIAAAGPLVRPEVTHVLLHDAARPAVPPADVEAVMAAVVGRPAVALCTPVRSTLVETDEGGNPVAYHLPRAFVHLLTPQGFDRKTFDELARTRVETHPSRVTLVKGSPLNVRVGGGGDASLVRGMIGMLPKPKARGNNNPFEEAQW